MSCMIFRYIDIYQVHTIEAPCARVFDFALMFTVHDPELRTTCEMFMNLPLTTLMYPPCGRVFISTTTGTFTHVMQLGDVGRYNIEIAKRRQCGPWDDLMILLADIKYVSNSFAGYRMTLYQLQLQYLSDLYGAFEIRNVAVLFNFLIRSPHCSVAIYYRKVVSRLSTERTRTPKINKVNELMYYCYFRKT